MIRASVVFLHTLLGTLSTTGALWLVAQANANKQWELGFYGRSTEVTEALLLGGVFTACIGVLQVVSAWGWILRAPGAGFLICAQGD